MKSASEITIEEVKPEEIDLDRYEVQPRKLGRRMNIIIGLIAILFSLFQLYTSWRGSYNIFIQRPIHLMFAFTILFAIYPLRKKSVKRDQILWSDWILIALTIICTMYAMINGDRYLEAPGETYTIDLVAGAFMTLVVLEGARRVIGPVLPVMAIFAIIYALFGDYIPGSFGHCGFSLRVVIETIYTSSLGVWGFITGLSASLIAGFLIFGVLFQKTGGGKVFVDLALRISGKSHGGPAKVSCFTSAFFGTISGSAIANVVVDGVFNIPLMKSLGYRKDFAGAVEATASAGGQLVPPIMGAGAFIMAEFLGIPYFRVAAGAAIPAALFYLGIYSAIHFQAQKLHYNPLPPDIIPSFRKILPKSFSLFLPVSVLIYLLAVGYSPALSILYTIFVSLGLYLLGVRDKETLKIRLKAIISGLDGGGKTIVMVAALCACAQVLVGLFNLTGLGVKLSQAVVSLFQGITFLILLSGMIISVILGMGIPTTAAYVLCAAVVAPAMSSVGAEPLSVHLFIFYFAVLAAITPPICGAVYVAASIAGSRWWEIALISSRLGLSGFIIPFMLIYSPALVLYGDVKYIIANSITAALGVISLSASLMGFFSGTLSLLSRILLFMCAIVLIKSGLVTDTIGIVMMGSIYVYQRVLRPKQIIGKVHK